jgi:hypothetical protein
MIFDELWRMERRQQKSKREFERKYKLMQQRKESREELNTAAEEAMMDDCNFYDDIETIKSSRLLGRANRLGLPTPESNGDTERWRRSYSGSFYLTRTAQAELRSRIRVEEKERREDRAFWVKDVFVPLFSVGIGFLGAAAGVIAAFIALRRK